MERPSFATLPTEILESIFLLLDHRTLRTLSQTSKSIHTLTNAPIIWRHLCRTHFRFWDATHEIAHKFAGPLSDVAWRELFLERVSRERRTLRLLGDLIRIEHGRARAFNNIAELGYDAKEALLREIACPDDAEDVLARRFWAKAALQRVHREVAIKVWMDVHAGKDVPIERAMGAFDMFVRADGDFDLDVIEEDIDQLTRGLLEQEPGFLEWSPRRKALTLAAYLRAQGFEGAPDLSYHAISNAFIGHALRLPTHASIPIVSVAIFCAIARRVALDARPCGIPYHVYTIIYSAPQHTLDGAYKPSSSSAREAMYLDPFRSADEVHRADLERMLRDMVPAANPDNYLGDTAIRILLLRNGRNILRSVHISHDANGPGRARDPMAIDVHNAYYATMWAILIFSNFEIGSAGADPAVPGQMMGYIEHICAHATSHSPWDADLLRKYLGPLASAGHEHDRLSSHLSMMTLLDVQRAPRHPRSAGAKDVRYRVGQLFRHRRYGYEGVVVGWDSSCGAHEDWIAQQGVDALANGRNQAFYNVLVSDSSSRYVAQENILPSCQGEEPSDELLQLAGQYFKRWDATQGLFISNVRAQYPDD